MDRHLNGWVRTDWPMVFVLFVCVCVGWGVLGGGGLGGWGGGVWVFLYNNSDFFLKE